jgi:GABA permease
LRKRLERESPQRLRFRMWLYPYLTWLAIVAMLCIVAAMAFIPDQRSSLLFGVVSAFVMCLGYLGRRIASRAYPR